MGAGVELLVCDVGEEWLGQLVLLAEDGDCLCREGYESLFGEKCRVLTDSIEQFVDRSSEES